MKSRSLFHIGIALLGALTGLSSYAALTWMPDLLRAPFFVVGISIVPGLVFGGLVTAISHRTYPLHLVSPVIVVGLTTLGWIVATDLASITAGYFETSSLSSYHLAIAGMAGGFAGGVLTAAGVGIANARFRRPRSFLPTIAAATLAGAMLQVGGAQMEGPLWVLFVGWQAVVAATISHGLARPATS